MLTKRKDSNAPERPKMYANALAGDALDVETWVDQMIAENGYAQLSIHDPNSGRPGCAFTLGLEHSRQSPELFCMGVSPEIASTLFSLCIEAHDAARVDLASARGDMSDLIEGFVVRLRRIPPALACQGQAARSDRCFDITALVQILMPDNAGRFPGDPSCDPLVAAAQDADRLITGTAN